MTGISGEYDYRLLDRYRLDNGIHGFLKTKHAGPDYQERVLWPFLHRFDGIDRPLILDLASGLGEVSRLLEEKGASAVQLDISRKALRATGGRCVQALFEPLPFRDAVFDGIHMKDALVHVPDRRKVFREARRVLKPNGIFLLVSQESTTTCVCYEEAGKCNWWHFKSQGQYLEFVSLLSHNPRVTSIEPPYYRTQAKDICREAQLLGLRCIDLRWWEPPEKEPDWHETSASRFVLTFRKEG